MSLDDKLKIGWGVVAFLVCATAVVFDVRLHDWWMIPIAALCGGLCLYFLAIRTWVNRTTEKNGIRTWRP